ncbi:hypothetical protein CONLIGDRAFT_703727 [Coniochaeta ligniaria NRRL 30616]|uniref:Uncharacterized protein n=1 Tax=Coniochaeta ligniaria NRRL 30616 TaxID=1408157 RepID=A0A1J7JFY5_9PEZI|nr:hypothetical protein CONLIGDRAFT_703727 [Coniochaeta ligniaria NRRL 30616]
MEATGSSPEKKDKPTGFFNLPVEIRMEIYRLCVPNGYVFDIREQPTFCGFWYMSRSPTALLNRPPMDYMSPVDFRRPFEPWADASSSDCREDENNETQSGNEQNLPAKYDSDTRQREYLRQRSELRGEAESTSNVDETEDDWETETEEVRHGEDDDREEDDDSEDGDSEDDDSEDDDSEDDDSEDDDSEDSDSEIIDPLNYISGIPIDDSEDDGSEDEGSEDEGSEDEGSEDEGSEDEGSEDEGSEDDDSEDDNDSEDDDSEDDDSEDSDSEIIDPLDHISGIPIDKWVDASSRPCFPFQKFVFVPKWVSTIRSLLITSHQIREEVLDILYGENVFRVAVGKYSCERALRNGFSKAKMQRMRHIMILYEQLSSSSGDGPEFRLDRNIWDRVLPNLSTLHLLASQPKEEVYIHRRDCRRSVAQMKMVWMKEVPPILAYLGRTLSQTATIMVDVDMWKVTSDLLDKFLGRNWSQVRTTTGDTLFQRPSTLHHESKWTDEIFDDFPIGCECVPYEEVDSELEYGLDLPATWEDDHGDYDPDNVPGSYFYSPRWTE